MNNLKPIIDEERPKVYIETYGCQMNVNDSEVILSILQKNGYALTEDMDRADVILANTCSIRDNAEQRIWGRIEQFRLQKKRNPQVVIGIVGCMAERLKDKLLEKVDLVPTGVCRHFCGTSVRTRRRLTYSSHARRHTRTYPRCALTETGCRPTFPS